MDNNNPLVTIVCLTYNHENYINRCLDGFLMQETNFAFEIFVHDDASIDNTPLIIKEYADKYPDKFRLKLQTENQYSRGRGYVGLRMGFENAKGKYIAYCEGDDYWIDSGKLQKQVDYLESNPKVEMCVHDTIVRDDSGKSKDVLFSKFCNNLFFNPKTNKIYTLNHTLTGNFFHITSILFKNKPILFPSWINSISALDMVMYMIIAERGDIFYMNDPMSVYRNANNSITNSNVEYSTQINFINLSIRIAKLMNKHFNRQYQSEIYYIIARYYIHLAFIYLKKGNRNFSQSKKMFYLASKYHKSSTLKYTIIEFYSWVKLHLKLK